MPSLRLLSQSQKVKRKEPPWFFYGAPVRRHLRKGVYLRVNDLPEKLTQKINEHISSHEVVERVIISEIQEDKKVLLEIWLASDKTHRIIRISTPEVMNWVCESNLGRGFRGN